LRIAVVALGHYLDRFKTQAGNPCRRTGWKSLTLQGQCLLLPLLEAAGPWGLAMIGRSIVKAFNFVSANALSRDRHHADFYLGVFPSDR
jgi:hypothetical protein